MIRKDPHNHTTYFCKEHTMTAFTDIELIARHTIDERTHQPRITRTRRSIFGRGSRD